MTIREDIKILLLKEKSTLVEVAKKLSLKSNQQVTADSISQKLRRDTIKFREVKEILDCLDYNIKFEKNN